VISAAEPTSYQKRAFALSLALHACVLGLLVALLPLWQATVSGYGLHDLASVCAAPCGRVFAIRIERRARAAATAGIRRVAQALLPATPIEHSIAAQHPISRHVYRESPAAHKTAPEGMQAATAALASTGNAGSNPNPTVATPAAAVIASASRLQPNALSANPSSGVQPAQPHSDAQMGPANWGSHFDTPTLLDRALYGDVVAQLPKGGRVTIVVDDQGHATDVRIDAPGLDPTVVAQLRARLLAARYASVERDGVAFDGTLTISSSLMH
jgi:hypothetical protein